jgi:DNA-binding FrmR family transcriptional regulator
MEQQEQAQDHKQDLLTRLNRIEGQVKGIKRMVDIEDSCVELLTQIAAVRAAINKVGGLILDQYAKDCVQRSFESETKDQEIKNLTESVQKFLKFID